MPKYTVLYRTYSKRFCVIVLLIRLFAKTDNLDISLDSRHEFQVSYKIGIALCVLAQYIVYQLFIGDKLTLLNCDSRCPSPYICLALVRVNMTES